MFDEVLCDATFYGGEVEYIIPVTRYASRGVVYNKEGLVALLELENVAGYKLPGGEIEWEESPQEAFVREVKEEMGYKITQYKNIGKVEEHKGQTNFCQYSYCFIGEVGTQCYTLNLTENEQKLGMKPVWLTLDEAINKLRHSLITCCDYRLKFMYCRDLMILEYVQEQELG
ncbi:MAG: NUDIX hydrolase [Turicibacter sp.]